MASTINASNSGFGGIVSTGDSSGQLALQAAGTTAVTINTSGALGVGSTPSFGTSGQLLTSAGSSAAPTWTTVSSGGMTLLGTLTTTSGTTQTLSGLTLTNYKYLSISINNVGYSSGTTNANLLLNTYNIARPAASDASTSMYGFNTIDLSSGAAQSSIIVGTIATNTTNSMSLNANTTLCGNLSAINTSTTSLSFTWSTGNTFATGTIKIYGVA
jgi:fibronectin-binding autotransporter adhesin